MKSILIILNHEPTEEQLQQLTKMGYQETIFIKHPIIDPKLEMEDVIDIFLNIVEGKVFDALWVQGDFRFFIAAYRFASDFNVPLYIATTHREAKEIVQPDGSVKKISVFRHVKFVEVTE